MIGFQGLLQTVLWYACSNGKMLMACSNAESGETEGTAKKEKGLEKKLLATKAWRHSATAWSDWRESPIKGSENDKDD